MMPREGENKPVRLVQTGLIPTWVRRHLFVIFRPIPCAARCVKTVEDTREKN